MSQQPQQQTQLSSEASEGFIQNVNRSLQITDVVSPLAEAAAEVADEVVTESTEAPAVEESGSDDLDLEAELDKLEGVEATDEAEPFSYESEQFKQLEKFVAEQLGIPSLKEAVESIKALQEQVASFEQARQAQTVETTANQLKAEWGVNEAEYARRVTAISDYHKGLLKSNPELARKLDNVEGMQLMWNRISSKKAPGISSSSTGKSSSSRSGPTFKKSDINNWMLNDPQTYQANAAAIAEARKAGRITND